MRPIYDHEADEFRIENDDGDIIYGPVTQFSWPLSQDADAMDAVLSESNIGQPQRNMWKLVFGAIELESTGDNSEQ